MVSLLEIHVKKHKDRSKHAVYASKLLSGTQSCLRHFIIPADSNKLEDLLTSAEKKVLQFIINTYTNQEIAEELGITLRTIKAHVCSVYKKLGVKNRLQCTKKGFCVNGFFALIG